MFLLALPESPLPESLSLGYSMTRTLTLLRYIYVAKDPSNMGYVFIEAMNLLFVQQACGMPAIVARHDAVTQEDTDNQLELQELMQANYKPFCRGGGGEKGGTNIKVYLLLTHSLCMC